jgi:HSP20 family molecular chaperone IbpA
VNFLCMERSFGVFRRVVILGAAVDISRATAVCRDGILQVRVPKVDEKRGRVRVVPVIAARSGERSEP